MGGGQAQTGVRGASDLFVASACTYEKELSKPQFSYSYSGKNNTSLAGLCQGLRNNAGDCLSWPMLFKWGFLATDGRSQSNLRKGDPGGGRSPKNVCSCLSPHGGCFSQHGLIQGLIGLYPLALWFRVVDVMFLRLP